MFKHYMVVLCNICDIRNLATPKMETFLNNLTSTKRETGCNGSMYTCSLCPKKQARVTQGSCPN